MHVVPLGNTPLVLQNVQTNLPVLVHVGVKDFRQERDLRGFRGVLLTEVQLQLEQPALPRGVLGQPGLCRNHGAQILQGAWHQGQ